MCAIPLFYTVRLSGNSFSSLILKEGLLDNSTDYGGGSIKLMSVGNNNDHEGYHYLNLTTVRDSYTRVVTHWPIGLMRSINYLYYLL